MVILPRPANGFPGEEAIAAWVLVTIAGVTLGLVGPNRHRAVGCPVCKHHYREVTPVPLSIAQSGALPSSQGKDCLSSGFKKGCAITMTRCREPHAAVHR